MLPVFPVAERVVERAQNGARPAKRIDPGRQSLADIVQEVERDAIVRALRQVEGNKERAAELLGLSPTTLWRKMKRLQLEWP